jgi:hypothetical protein
LETDTAGPYMSFENSPSQYNDDTYIKNVSPRIYFEDPTYNFETGTFTGTIDLTNGGVTDFGVGFSKTVSIEVVYVFPDNLLSKTYKKANGLTNNLQSI